MVDVHEDPTTVHLTRTRAHEDALRAQNAEAKTAPADEAGIGALVDALDAPASVPPPAGTALVQDAPAPASAAAPSLGLRLGVTAALVLVLLVAWIAQRRRAAS